MKKRNINIFFLLLIAFIANGQLKHPSYFEDYQVPSTYQQVQMNSNSTSLTSLFSPNGQVFTPKGDMKVLIICASIGEPFDSYPLNGWAVGSNTLPDWVTSNQTFYTDNDQFNSPATENDKNNISRFYYEMSKGVFRLTADVYPTRVNVSSVGVSGNPYWPEMNRKVIEKMKNDNPTFDWSKYDKRINNPNFAFDNSITTPDNIPDYIVITYRYANANSDGLWKTNPPTITSGGGYAAIDGLTGLNYNGYTFNSSSGYTHSLGTTSMYTLFIHEVSHSLFNAPHYADNNGTVGKYFYNEVSPWGFMNLLAFNCANGWERWYLGWIGLTANGVNSDIKSMTDLPPNGEFTLRDFVTTGDVVRLKIPNGTGKNQYIWLENHTGISIYDNSSWSSNNGCVDNAYPSSARGLVAYNESISDDKENPYNFSFTNGIKPFHSKGNHDYTFATQNTTPSCLLWGSLIYNMIEGDANPLSGQNRGSGIRLDYNNDGIIPVNEDNNGVPNYLREYYCVTMRNGIITYDFFGSDMNFSVGQKLGIATNPTLINRSTYNTISQKMSSFYLNGISISILSQDANGNIKVKISYNDVTINSNIRWTGNIILPNITNSTEPDLIISANQTLTINKSGTPNRHVKNTFNEFVNPTEFTCAQNSLFKMLSSSNTIVENLSTFTLETGSTLEINDVSVLTIQNGSTLQIKSGANLNILGSGKIVVKSGGYICVESGATINLQD
ncbi:MAG: hypothetical protein ACOYMD_02365 [Paludibacter sp.]